MNLRFASQAELLSLTKAAISQERLSTIKVLHHFREIERRRSFSGHSSLFELAVKHFGYSAASAQRRIQAMRPLKDLLEFKTKIESGELSLTAAASAQSFFRRSNVLKSAKVELLNSCLNRSSREVEKEIAKLEPAVDKRPDIRYSKSDRLRMSINISEGLYEKLEKLKFELQCSSIEQVIEKLADQAKSLPAPEVKARQKNRYIPKATRRIVLKKSKPHCAYTHPESGKPCIETAKLQFDHIYPYSKGGPHLTENLRLLCAHHNKLVWQTEQKNI